MTAEQKERLSRRTQAFPDPREGLKQENLSSSLGSNRLLSIGEASRLLSVSIDTLRNWEQKGRLLPKRSAGGIRRYSLTEIKKFAAKDQKLSKALDKNLSIHQPETVEEELSSTPVTHTKSAIEPSGMSVILDELKEIKQRLPEQKKDLKTESTQPQPAPSNQTSTPIFHPQPVTIQTILTTHALHDSSLLSQAKATALGTVLVVSLITLTLVGGYYFDPKGTLQTFGSDTIRIDQSSEQDQVLGIATTPSQNFLQTLASPFTYLAQQTIQLFDPQKSQELAQITPANTPSASPTSEELAELNIRSQEILKEIDKIYSHLNELSTTPQTIAYSDQVETTAANILRNSSFEFNSSGQPSEWLYTGQSTSANTFVNNGAVRTGNRSLRIEPKSGSNSHGVYQPHFLTKASRVYTLSLYINNQTNQNIILRVSFWDKNNNTKVLTEDKTISTTPGWQRISLTLDPASQNLTGHELYPMIEVLGATQGNVYLDDIDLSEGSSLSVYDQENMQLGDGSIRADEQGNLYPINSRNGSIGIDQNRFRSLYLMGATIDENGNTSLSGTLTASGQTTFNGTANFSSIGSSLTPTTDNTYDLGNSTYRWGSAFIGTTLKVDGNTTLGDNSSDIITANGRFNTSLIPSTADSYDLGDASNLWRNGYFAGDLTVNGGDLSSSAATFNLLTTPTTLNIGSSATTLSLGASTGTTTINTAITAITGNTTIAGTTGATLTGNGAGITFSGTGNHDITASSGTLRLGAFTATGAITASTGGINIGSSGTRFGTVYADEGNFTTLTAGSTNIGGTDADTFTVNSDNATADTENAFLAFERGSVTPNALLSWTAASDVFDFNSQVTLTPTIASTTGLTIGGFTTGLSFSSTSTTTDISLQNGATIDNNVSGTLQLTAATTATSGNLTISGGTFTASSATTITLGGGSTTALSLTDDNWSINASGAGTFASVSAGSGAVSGGAATFSSLTVTGNSDLRGDLADSTGNLTINDAVDISGITTLTGNLNANGGLDIDDAFVVADGGALTTSGNISQTGATTFSTGTGSVSLNGTTTVNASIFEVSGSNARVRISDTSQTDPAGRFDLISSGDTLITRRAATSSWGTADTLMTISQTVLTLDNLNLALGSGNITTTGTVSSGAITSTGTSAFDALTIGGGYGSTGVTISSAGAISANGALIVDSTSTFSDTATITKADGIGLSLRSGNTANYTYLQLGRTSEEGVLGIAAATNNFLGGATAGDLVLRAGASGDLVFGYGSTRIAQINNAGGFEVVQGGLTVTAGGATITAGNLAVNSDTITSDGALSIEATGYVRIGDNGTPGIAGDDDLYVAGWIEVDGDIQLDGGNLGIGGAPLATTSINIVSSALTGTSQWGVIDAPIFSSAATTAGYVFNPQVKTAASAFTMANAYAIYVDNASIGATSAITNLYGIYIAAQSGAATTNIGLYNAGTTTLVGAVTTSGDLTIGDQLIVSGTGPHVIGGVTDARKQLRLTGTFSPSTGAHSALIEQDSTLNAAASENAYGMRLAPTIVEAGSGTHGNLMGVSIDPTFTGGLGATTNAASLYVVSAPTIATNNYALWVDSGATQLDGTLNVGTTATIGTGLTVSAGGAAISGTVTEGSLIASFGNSTDAYKYATIYSSGTVAGSYTAATSAVLNLGSSPVRKVSLNATGGAIFGTSGDGGSVYINDSSNTNSALGMTINQAANDDEILALKSSDVAHGVTTLHETDTYGVLRKYTAADGGLMVRGLSDVTTGLSLQGLHTTDTTTKSTSSEGAIHLVGALKSGTTAGSIGTNGNVLTIANNASTQWLVDAEGDTWQNGDLTTTGGNLGLTTSAAAARSIYSTTTLSGATSQYGIALEHTYNSESTGAGYGLRIAPSTAASVFTMSSAYGLFLDNPAKGTGSVITSNYGTYVSAMTAGGTNNYGVYIENPSGGSTTNHALSISNIGTGVGTIAFNGTNSNMKLNYYDGGNQVFEIQTSESNYFRLQKSGGLYLNDISNANSTVGFTINQGANDDEVLTLKSSDITHGITSISETDTYARFLKSAATNGGLRVDGLSAATEAIRLFGIGTTDNTTKGTSALGYVVIDGAKKSLTTTSAPGANANILAIRDGHNGTSQWLLDVEGDVWQNGDITINGNDITFGNGESISNATDSQLSLAATTVRLTTSNAWIAGAPSGVNINMIRLAGFGYSAVDYRAVQLGSGNSISLGVDVSAITGGNFGGSNEIILPYAAYNFKQVNAAGTDFTHIMAINQGGGLTIAVGGLTVTAGGATITAGGVTVNGGNLSFAGQATPAIQGGSSSLTFNNAANSASNVTITDAGAVTIHRAGLTVTTGGATITAGGLGVHSTPNAASLLTVGNTTGSVGTPSSIEYGANIQPLFTSTATTEGRTAYFRASTANAVFTMANATGIYIDSPNKGASSTITTARGLYVNAQTAGGTANYGAYIEAPSGSATDVGLYVAGGDTGMVIAAGGANITGDSVIVGTSTTSAHTLRGGPNAAGSGAYLSIAGSANGGGVGHYAVFTPNAAANADVERFRVAGVAAVTATTFSNTNVTINSPASGTALTIAGGGTSITGNTTMTGHLYFSADATYDIGANTTTTRPRNIYMSGTLSIGGPGVNLSAGSGTLTLDAGVSGAGNGLFYFLNGDDVNVASIWGSGLRITPPAISSWVSGDSSALSVTGAAHTGLNASTEHHGTQFNLSATKTWATGALTTQREFLIQAPTYAFAGASTITSAVTMEISGAPVKGTSATITNGYALRIAAGNTNSTTTAYSLYVDAPTGAATNIAAAFNGQVRTVGSNGYGLGKSLVHFDGSVSGSDNSAIISNISVDASSGNEMHGLHLQDIPVATTAETNLSWRQLTIGAGTKSGAGTITTAYGLYINAPTAGSTNIGLYNAGTTGLIGNVGIGTISPTAKLDVSGGNIEVDRTSYIGSCSSCPISIGTSGGSQIGFLASGGDDILTFYTHRTGVHHKEMMRIDRDGNVGIGTTAPRSQLELFSSSANVYNYVTGRGTDVGIQLTDDNSNFDASRITWYPYHEGSTNKFHIAYYNAGTSQNVQRMTIDTGGNVGIGTVTPSQLLDVYSSSSRLTVSTAGRVTVPTTGSSAGIVLGATNTVTLVDTPTTAERAGTARRTYVITYSPEYDGAVLDTDGSSTTSGDMVTDNDDSANAWRNYYLWTSSQASNQDYTIMMRVTLPEDFDGWATGSCPGSTCALEVGYKTGLAATTNNGVTVSVYNATDTPSSAVCSISEVASTSWTSTGCTSATLDDASAPEWDAAAETAIIKIKLKANSTASAAAYAGDITLRYLSKFK